MINLKNYTTTVTAEKSITNINKLLVAFGASNIMYQYGPVQNLVAISFIINVENQKLPFRLPAKVDNIFKWLRKSKPQTGDKVLKDQAERIAWKHLHEWLHIQLTSMELEQADKIELLLAYVYDPQTQETYYDKLKKNNYKALIS